jgi:hypothetical protein
MSEDSAPPGKEGMLAAACAALDEFMAAFNARDHERWVKCFHFPTVRLAGGEVLVWSTPEEFLRSNDIGVLSKSGWHHSTWDWRKLVQSSDAKMHVLVQFTRHRSDGEANSYESLYVLTNRDGRWAVQARSSFLGITLRPLGAER